VFRKALVLAASVFLAASASAADSTQPQWYTVNEIISGDSFRVDGGSVVRYASLTAPDPRSEVKRIEDFATESIAFNKQLLEGRKVSLEWGSRIRDKKGRYLAYVHTEDGTFINQKVLAEGFAKLSIEPPNLEYAEALREAAMHARRDKKGLWRHETDHVEISFIADQMKRVYHYPGCELVDDIPSGHQIRFSSSVAAKAEGFRFCNVCKTVPRQETDLF